MNKSSAWFTQGRLQCIAGLLAKYIAVIGLSLYNALLQ